MTTGTPTIDMSAHYSVSGYDGIAWYLIGYDTTWTEETWTYCGEGDEDDEASYLYNEPEEIENRDRVRAVMVGDDRVFTFDVDEITQIHGLDYCAECGQIGCTHDGRSRDEDDYS